MFASRSEREHTMPAKGGYSPLHNPANKSRTPLFTRIGDEPRPTRKPRKASSQYTKKPPKAGKPKKTPTKKRSAKKPTPPHPMDDFAKICGRNRPKMLSQLTENSGAWELMWMTRCDYKGTTAATLGSFTKSTNWRVHDSLWPPHPSIGQPTKHNQSPASSHAPPTPPPPPDPLQMAV